jgi:small-conductance mechanosensitive channel
VVSLSIRNYQVVAPLGYVMDYIGSWLILAQLVSWMCFAVALTGFFGVVGWILVSIALLMATINFIPSCLQAYSNSRGYSGSRRYAVWIVLFATVYSYIVATGSVFTHMVWNGIIALLVNTVAMALLCSMTHSTPRWSFRPIVRKTDEES